VNARRWILLLLLLLSLLSGGVLWLTSPKESDLSVKFSRFENREGKRLAVFRLENRCLSTRYYLGSNPETAQFYLHSASGTKDFRAAIRLEELKQNLTQFPLEPGEGIELAMPLIDYYGEEIKYPFRVAVPTFHWRPWYRDQGIWTHKKWPRGVPILVPRYSAVIQP